MPVAAVERAAVRPHGIASQAVHRIVCDERHRVWVRQRAFDKATNPGRWDTTVGGLVAAGESARLALARETWEEAGLHVADLQGLAPMRSVTVRRPAAEGFVVEHIDLLEATMLARLPLANQDDEVKRFDRFERFGCLDTKALVERLHADAFTPEAGMKRGNVVDGEAEMKRSSRPKKSGLGSLRGRCLRVAREGIRPCDAAP